MKIICDRDLNNVTGGTGTAYGRVVGGNVGALAGSVVGFYVGVKMLRDYMLENDTSILLGFFGLTGTKIVGSIVGGVVGASIGFAAGSIADDCKCE